MKLTVRISDIARPISRRATSECSLPVYSVTKHEGMVPSSEYFKKQVYSRDVEGYKIVSKGQFAYATIHLDEGSIGVLERADECVVSPMYTVFEVDESRVHSPYLLRLLKSRWALKQYTILGNGSVHRRRSIPFEALARLEVSLPSMADQQRAARILDKAASLRRKRREAIQLADECLRAAYLHLAQHHPANVPVETLLADVPNAARTGPFGSQLLVSEFTESGIPVLGIDNVVSNAFTWAAPRFISFEKYAELQRYTVRPGDVMVTIMGTTGRVAIAPDDLPTCISTKHLCALTLDRRKMLPTYLWACLRWDPEVRAQTRRETKGAIMEGWNMGIVKELLVNVPPMDVQLKFEEIASRIKHMSSAQALAAKGTDDLMASLSAKYLEPTI